METGTRPRVLYVDDNWDVADTAAALLRLVGLEVRVCYDGPSALAAAADFHPDVCMVDLNMPGMDGDEVVRRLRAGGDGRPVLFVAVTAMSNEEARERTHAAGFHLHLVKPVDPHDMLRVVDHWTELLQAAGQPSAATGPHT